MARLGRAQPFPPLLRRFRGAAGGDVTVGLTGVAATCAVGTLAVTLTLGLTGTPATAAVGTPSPSTTAATSGTASTGAVGTVGISTTVGLTGAEGVRGVGYVSPSGGSGSGVISFDAISTLGSGTGDRSWTHTPTGTPKGVVVTIETANAGGTDFIVGVTYGGSAMTEVSGSPVLESGGEGCSAHAFVLLSSVPTGAQTVAIDTDSSFSYIAQCTTLTTPGGDCEVVDSDGTINSASITNPSVTISLTGRACFCLIAFSSGQNATSGVTPLTGWTPQHEVTMGGQTAGMYTYDTINTVDVTAGWTQTAEDACAIAVALAAVSTGAEVGVTGIAATGAAGTLSPSTTIGLTGEVVTGAVGTLSPALVLAVTGLEATTAVGTLGPSTTIGLTGTEGTGATGSVGTSGEGSSSLTGIAATGAVGTLSPSTTVALTGEAATGAVGTLGPGTTIGLVGQAGTGETGSVGTAGTGSASLVGIGAAGAAGTFTPQTAIALSGTDSTGEPGSLTSAAIVPLTGVVATASAGTVTTSGGTLVVVYPTVHPEVQGSAGSTTVQGSAGTTTITGAA